MATKLTIPIPVLDVDSVTGRIKAALDAGAEAIELRMDYLKNLSAELAGKITKSAKVAAEPVPVIVTCRDKRQGGVIDYPQSLRTAVFVEAVKTGADFIDIEYENFLVPEIQEFICQALSDRPQARLILSAHNFDGRFEDIKEIGRDIVSVCPEAIPKLVYTANHITDCFEAFDVHRVCHCEMIVFCMGQAGLISRIITKKLGSFLTFASLESEAATAPGQINADVLKRIYRWDNINTDTELHGVIGSPVAHSLSPHIHNGCFDKAGLNKLYLPFFVEGAGEEFNAFMDSVLERPWLGFRGFSITIPHKQNALNYVKQKSGHIDELAEKIGAVNTLIIDSKERLSVFNTDCTGAMKAICSGLNIDENELAGLEVAIIGAGGVARAIVAGLSAVGAKIKIYNRTVEKARKLAAEFDCEFAGLDKLSELDAKLVVNCTSIGMHPDTAVSPIQKEYLRKSMVVFDTVYNPRQTLLLELAAEVGAGTINGLSMFVNQAAEQFRLFTGKEADLAMMYKILKKFL